MFKLMKTFVLITIILATASFLYLQTKLPQRDGELVIPGLSAQVTVHYDTYGIPHIEAQNDLDMYRAFGYVHAQDRLFQMDLLRRLGQGRLAEWFGLEAVKMDRLFRTLQVTEFTDQWMADYRQKAPQPILDAMDAYLAGVNHYIDDGVLPIEYALIGTETEHFDFNDMGAVLGFTAFSFTYGITQDVMLTDLASRLDPEYIEDLGVRWQPGSTVNPVSQESAQQMTAYMQAVIEQINPAGIFQGSNGWVLAPSKTKSGKAMLVNDPHMGFAQPSVWYEAHLKSPESEIYGHHLAMVPFAFLGHNEDIAWGLTMFLNDDIDLYREKQNPDNVNQYWNNDQWQDYSKTETTIYVKGAKPVMLNLKRTTRGPVINTAYELFEGAEDPMAEQGGAPLSMWWLFYEPNNDLVGPLYELSRAKSPEDAKAAAKKILAPGLNVMYADKNDNIAWWATGKLIERPKHVTSSMILDGASGNDEPLGYYDFNHNPQILNPERGFLLTANNQPADTGIGMVPGYYVARDRAQRIEALLQTKDDWDAESVKAMLLDTQSPLVKYVQERALTLIDRAQLSETANDHLDTLLAWDGVHEVDSIAPSLFYYYKKQLLTASFSDEMEGHNFNLFLTGFLRQKTIWKLLDSPKSPWWDDVNTETKESMKAIVTKAWQETMTKITDLGVNDERLKWRHMLRMVHQHPFGISPQMAKIFNIGPLPAAGGNETINNMIFKLDKEPFITDHGPSTRRIVDFADMTNSWGINPTGQSGVVNDKHYDDQAIMFSKGEFRPQWFTPEQIKANTASSLILLPK